MSNIPYTTAKSDFLKVAPVDEEYRRDLVDFTATDFATLRQSLIDYVKAVYPNDYNNFEESDLGMMFIELVSYMGSIMSYKSDMLAHESFIKTAKDRTNVRKLLELIGIRLRGPVGGAGAARVTAETAGLDHTVQPQNRVVTVTSPEDNQPVSYTLYTVTNGMIDDPNANSTISLLQSDADSPTVWTNLALLEGSFAREEGPFNEIDNVKEIALAEGPVIEGSVQVFIQSEDTATSGAYVEVESLYAASSTDQKIFSVKYDDEYRARVIFGDGTNGVIPPNTSEYVVTYRVGGGVRGNVPRSYINTSFRTNIETVTLENIQAITGGAEAETVDKAKKYGPLTFRTQDRLVSLDDYKSFASRFVGPTGTSAKAVASVRKSYSSANIVDLFVLEKASTTQLQKASLSFKNALLEAIEGKKMLTDEIVLVDGLIRTLDLVITISVSDKFKPKEGEIIRRSATEVQNFFNVDNREFGERLLLADINRAVFDNVDEVKVSRVDNLDNDVRLEFNEIIQLNNLVINIEYV
jgi:hypothetical protein